MRSWVIFALLVTVITSAVLNQPANSTCLKLLIPLYIYPTHYNPDSYVWRMVAAAQRHVPITAVINPNNGAGNAPPNRDYVQGLQDLRSANVKLLGYVSTRYGDRNLDEIKAEIDIYDKYYGINGIFLDEAASQANQLDYYQGLYQYIKAKPKLEQVVLNQGTYPDEGYLTRPAADTVIIFENYSREWVAYKPPVYIPSYTADRFSVLIHSAPDVESMKRHLDLALKRQLKYVYVTDGSPDQGDHNPWNQLPSYWEEEVNYIESLNHSARDCSGNRK